MQNWQIWISCDEEILSSNQKRIIEQYKFTYSPSGKPFKEQTQEQVKATKDSNISDKTDEFKQKEGIFPQNLINDLIRDKLKKDIDLQASIELDKLKYNYDFNNVLLPAIILRDIYANNLSIENAANEQSDLIVW